MNAQINQLRNQIIEEKRVSYYLDDSLNVVEPYDIDDHVRLVCFQCGFEPLVVAVRSYLDVNMDADEAVEIAEDYLREIGWLHTDHSEIYTA